MWQRFKEFYDITGWIDMDGTIHPNVSKSDRRIIHGLGYAILLWIVCIYIALLFLSVPFHEAAGLT